MLVLLLGCARAIEPSDAGSDASTDAGADAASPDAGPACASGHTVAYAQALADTAVLSVNAIAANAIDGTFVIGGDLTILGLHGARLTWRDEPPAPGLVRTYDAASLLDLAVDVHGNLTIGGVFHTPATIERVPVAEPGVASTVPLGFVARVVMGVAPTVTTLGRNATSVSVARHGDGYVAAGDGSITIGTDHCDAASGTYVAAFALEGTLEWLRCITSDGALGIEDISTHDAGDTYVVGDLAAGATLSVDGVALGLAATSSSAWVLRLGGSGSTWWARGLPGVRARSVAVAGSRVVLVGSEIVVLDLLDGSERGRVAIEGPNGEAGDVAIDRCGTAWVTAWRDPLGDLQGNGVLMHVDPMALTSETVLDVPSLWPRAVAVSIDGTRVGVAGHYRGTPTVGATTLPPSPSLPQPPSDELAAFVLGLR